MVKIAGYWDLWFSHRENEYDISWRFMLKHFGVDEVILIPNINASEKIALDYTEVPLIEMNSIQEVLAANSHLTPVILDERGSTSLKIFNHPENVLYIFGKTGLNPLDQLPDWSGEIVSIENVERYENNNALLHPSQACAIILYDRMRKQWP